MTPVLAILRRHPGTILLTDGSRSGLRGPYRENEALTFSRAEDAETYLSFWAGDSGAMDELRRVLQDVGHSRVVSRCSNREVVHALAARVVEGRLRVFERTAPRPYLDVRVAFSAAAAKSAKPATRAPSETVVTPVATTVAAPSAPAVLPALQQVQIEGARVLPEILQTLEQLDVSLGGLHLASVSLEPTPSAVPSISDSMVKVSDSVTTTIDDL